MALMAAVIVLGEPVLGFLLGPEWRVDTYFLFVVVGALAVRICVSPFSSVLFTAGRLGHLFAWQFAYFATAFSVLPFAASRLGFDRFLFVYLLHETVLYTVYMVLIVRARAEPRKVLGHVWNLRIVEPAWHRPQCCRIHGVHPASSRSGR